MAYIVTGYIGEPHISSDDMASFQRGVVGIDDYVLNSTDEFTATATSQSVIKLSKAEIVIQGVHARIEGTEEVNISSGTQGLYRHDYIIAKYKKDPSNGVESVEVGIKNGEPAQEAAEPALVQNDIRNGGTEREVALFDVYIYGSIIQSITRVIPYVYSLNQIGKNSSNIAKLNTTVSSHTKSIGEILTSIKTLMSKLDFEGTLRSVAKYSKAAIATWVSTYDTKGNPDVLGAAICCQNAKGTNLASLRLYSDGRLALYKGDTRYLIPIVKSGTVSISITKADTPVKKEISFGCTYSSEPTVMCTPRSTLPDKIGSSVANIGKSKCDIYASRESDGTVIVDWVAFGYL